MNHTDVRNHMADYLECDLALERRALFDAHLDECSECSSEITAMRGTISLLRGLPEPVVPPQLTNDVMRRIRAGDASGGWLHRLSEVGAALLDPRVLAPASAAMLALGIVLATGQLQMGGPQPMSAQPLVQIEVVRSDSSVPRGLGAHGPMVSERRLIAFGDAQVTGRRFGGPVPAQELVQISERIRSWERAPGPSGGGFGAVAASGAGTAPSDYVAVQLDSSSGIPSQGQRAVWSADRWLDFAEQRPAAFAAGLSNAGRTSLAEHELWVKSLVRRALETGRLDRIVDALQLSTTADARSLARDFQAEGRKVSAAGSTDSIGRAD